MKAKRHQTKGQTNNMDLFTKLGQALMKKMEQGIIEEKAAPPEK